MRRLFLLVCILLISEKIFSQHLFEGDIIYNFELQKKDSSFDETSIITYPAKITVGIFKNGNWIQKPDDGIIEYMYFNHATNRIYWKIRNIDTLLYEQGDQRRESEIDSTLTSSIKYGTDTILGYPCNRLILQTTRLKLIFIYSPLLAVDPLWYQHTRIGYYDIVYGLTKGIYLTSIVESKEYISKMIAQSITPRHITDTEFPDIDKLSLKRL